MYALDFQDGADILEMERQVKCFLWMHACRLFRLVNK